MDDENIRLATWSQRLREERQEVDRSEVFGPRLDDGTSGSEPDWIGLKCSSENNETGSAELLLALRPVVQGRVELVVTTETKGVDAVRSHKKTVYLAPTTKALREFAQVLLSTADRADAIARKSGPKLVK